MNGRKVGLVLGFCFALTATVLYLGFIIGQPVIENKLMPEHREPMLVTGDADPGDNSGFFYFMIYPHQADPATAYASNLSNATAYEFSDVGNTTCTGETPYSTTFDIAIKVGATNEDTYYTANQTKNDAWNWCLLTCADLGIGADTNMSQICIGNNTDYVWYHYYLNNGGAGYTITEGQSFNITAVKYYVQRIV